MQLEICKAWVGSWGVLAVTSGNIVVGKGARLAKWPKCKARMIHDDTREPFEPIHIPEGRNDLPTIIPDVSDVDSRSDIDLPSDIDPEIEADGRHLKPEEPAISSQANIGIVAPRINFLTGIFVFVSH